MIAASQTINVGPVFSAGKIRSIRNSLQALPNMRDTILGWFKPMVIGIITTAIVGDGDEAGEAKEISRELRTAGVVLPDEENLRPDKEGERSWQNWVMWVLPQLDVATDTKLLIQGISYRVMGRKDFSANGYMRYHLTQDFKSA